MNHEVHEADLTVVFLIAFACRALPSLANTTPTTYVLRVVRLTWVQLSRSPKDSRL